MSEEKQYPKVNVGFMRDKRLAQQLIYELNQVLLSASDFTSVELKQWLDIAYDILEDSYFAVLKDRDSYLHKDQVNELSAIINGLTHEIIGQYRYSSL